ncbi:hypothetical protein DH2020_047092 [Rehmannia glutinosa]|uniref:Piwi domain-containing protein n=1 Tax=Rehmannia glutinosa TaxID=99300 RepID=A0ABR0UAC8_REHGL
MVTSVIPHLEANSQATVLPKYPAISLNSSSHKGLHVPLNNFGLDYTSKLVNSLANSSTYLDSQISEVEKEIFLPCDKKNGTETVDAKPKSLAVAKRPDSGGVEGKPIALVANHFLVDLIRHRKFSTTMTIYSPIEFQDDKLEFYISLPIEKNRQHKIFRVNIKLVSKFDGNGDDFYNTPLPQEYIHALDVVLRESPAEKCFSVGRSFYSSSFGGAKEIGGGAIALKGFFQSLRPTQQGLSLNVDFSISRRKPCYLPMELCVICEGQKFLGKLSDDQTVKLLKMGCQKPRERKKIIDSVMEGQFGPTSLRLKLGNGGHVRNLTPFRHDRQWNLLDSHVFEADARPGNAKLLESKLRKSIKPLLVISNFSLCVMERKHRGYADLKRIAETSIGIVSQCCLYSNIGKLGSQFLANLALKINAKVGGCTVALYNSLPSEIPRIFRQDDPVIFMGADVTHPHPLDDFSPSVAAVVGSVNWPAANKYVSRMRSQTHRQEIIQDLCAMVKEILEDFYQELSKLPKRIIFFRDGVSETQFHKVLQDEMQQIREACSRFPGYKPPITFAVVQKRHHTRLFPKPDPSLSENQFLDKNIPPGTVVDTAITHPTEFDFYLCSHWGIKGTSRPVHYHVLWDDNEFTSDEVQKLVYNLCYTFVRCTKPVSLVPPVYYAHLAAYRGRLYLDRSDSRSCTISRSSSPEAIALPKLSDNIRKLMFYC